MPLTKNYPTKAQFIQTCMDNGWVAPGDAMALSAAYDFVSDPKGMDASEADAFLEKIAETDMWTTQAREELQTEMKNVFTQLADEPRLDDYNLGEQIVDRVVNEKLTQDDLSEMRDQQQQRIDAREDENDYQQGQDALDQDLLLFNERKVAQMAHGQAEEEPIQNPSEEVDPDNALYGNFDMDDLQQNGEEFGADRRPFNLEDLNQIADENEVQDERQTEYVSRETTFDQAPDQRPAFGAGDLDGYFGDGEQQQEEEQKVDGPDPEMIRETVQLRRENRDTYIKTAVDKWHKPGDHAFLESIYDLTTREDSFNPEVYEAVDRLGEPIGEQPYTLEQREEDLNVLKGALDKIPAAQRSEAQTKALTAIDQQLGRLPFLKEAEQFAEDVTELGWKVGTKDDMRQMYEASEGLRQDHPYVMLLQDMKNGLGPDEHYNNFPVEPNGLFNPIHSYNVGAKAARGFFSSSEIRASEDPVIKEISNKVVSAYNMFADVPQDYLDATEKLEYTARWSVMKDEQRKNISDFAEQLSNGPKAYEGISNETVDEVIAACRKLAEKPDPNKKLTEAEAVEYHKAAEVLHKSEFKALLTAMDPDDPARETGLKVFGHVRSRGEENDLRADLEATDPVRRQQLAEIREREAAAKKEQDHQAGPAKEEEKKVEIEDINFYDAERDFAFDYGHNNIDLSENNIDQGRNSVKENSGNVQELGFNDFVNKVSGNNRLDKATVIRNPKKQAVNSAGNLESSLEKFNTKRLLSSGETVEHERAREAAQKLVEWKTGDRFKGGMGDLSEEQSKQYAKMWLSAAGDLHQKAQRYVEMKNPLSPAGRDRKAGAKQLSAAAAAEVSTAEKTIRDQGLSLKEVYQEIAQDRLREASEKISSADGKSFQELPEKDQQQLLHNIYDVLAAKVSLTSLGEAAQGNANTTGGNFFAVRHAMERNSALANAVAGYLNDPQMNMQTLKKDLAEDGGSLYNSIAGRLRQQGINISQFVRSEADMKKDTDWNPAPAKKNQNIM